MTVSQTQFEAALRDPEHPVPAGLHNPDAGPARKRFDVYRNNVAVSLADALETAFPIIRKLVGDAFFRAMAGVYQHQHPPASPLMMFYGDAMPDFLASFPPAQTLPYLADIARIEIGMRRAYHAADATPVSADAISQIQPGNLPQTRLRLAPAIGLIQSAYPIHGIYLANTKGTKLIQHGAEAVLITRPAFDPEIHLISTAAHDCIASLLAGQPLGQAMAAAGEAHDLGATLGLLLAQGAVTNIH